MAALRHATRRREARRLPVGAGRRQGGVAARTSARRSASKRRIRRSGHSVHHPPPEQLLPERLLVSRCAARRERLSAADRRCRPLARRRSRHRRNGGDGAPVGRSRRQDLQRRRADACRPARPRLLTWSEALGREIRYGGNDLDAWEAQARRVHARLADVRHATDVSSDFQQTGLAPRPGRHRHADAHPRPRAAILRAFAKEAAKVWLK